MEEGGRGQRGRKRWKEVEGGGRGGAVQVERHKIEAPDSKTKYCTFENINTNISK